MMSIRFGIGSTLDRPALLTFAAEAPRLAARLVKAILVGGALSVASLGSAFAADGDSFGCNSTFTSCTAGVLNSDSAVASLLFSSVRPGYIFPTGLQTSNTVRDDVVNTTTAPLTANVGNCLAPPCAGVFVGNAQASSQSDFGLNRAVATAGFGGDAIDDQGNGGTASVRLITAANASSNWHDVWSFSQNGHASASTAVDGRSAPSGGATFPFPLGGMASSIPPDGGWGYGLAVLDLDHFVPNAEGTLRPMEVANASARGVLDNVPFEVALSLDFDFLANHSYLVVADLFVFATDGAVVDLYNTARFGALTLSNGATMSAMSGHDYGATAMPVPEPEVWMSMMAGGLAMLGICRRRVRIGPRSKVC